MAEIKYRDVRKWLDEAAKLRSEGHHLFYSDDPHRRLFTFVDNDSEIHLIGTKFVVETSLNLTAQERADLACFDGRKKIIEGTT